MQILASVVCLAVQSAALRSPAVRRALNIPLKPAITIDKLPSMMDTVRYIKMRYEKSVAEGRAQQGSRR